MIAEVTFDVEAHIVALAQVPPADEHSFLLSTTMAPSKDKAAADATVATVGYEDDANKQRESKTPAKAQQPAQSRKAALSAYMTIAAAAFGLISDGCTCKVCVQSTLSTY